jgi:hypothetical protein
MSAETAAGTKPTTQAQDSTDRYALVHVENTPGVFSVLVWDRNKGVYYLDSKPAFEHIPDDAELRVTSKLLKAITDVRELMKIHERDYGAAYPWEDCAWDILTVLRNNSIPTFGSMLHAYLELHDLVGAEPGTYPHYQALLIVTRAWRYLRGELTD